MQAQQWVNTNVKRIITHKALRDVKCVTCNKHFQENPKLTIEIVLGLTIKDISDYKTPKKSLQKNTTLLTQYNYGFVTQQKLVS